MKIGIIAAMEEEKRLLAEKMTIEKQEEIAGWLFLTGFLEDKKIVLVQSGIGKVMSAMAATLLIDHFQVNLVINTGSAGGLGTSMKIGDIVIASELAYSDADVTAFNYAFGQMPGMPVRFPTKKMEKSMLEDLSKEVQETFHSGLIVSADSFIHRQEQRMAVLEHFPDALATEMEGAAIAQACYAFHIPVIVVRAISDMPEKGTSAIDFDTFIVEAGKKSAQLVQYLIRAL